MKNSLPIIIYTVSGIIVAISQIMMKRVADKNVEKKGIKKLTNPVLVLAYAMMMATVFMNMYAMRFMNYKYAPVLATLSYIFVFVLSIFVLKEKVRFCQLLGTVVIFFGIIVFYIGTS